MSNYITTFSRVKFSPLEPHADYILIDDVAHALSLMSRANGHFPEFYSVGQHSVFCCEEALKRGYSNRVALACLLHDASEAYIADIIRPVKKSLDKYLEIEESLQNTIYKKFLGDDLTEDEQSKVNCIDNTLLYYEFVHYMNMELEVEKGELSSSPEFKFQQFLEVEHRYKDLFNQLINEI